MPSAGAGSTVATDAPREAAAQARTKLKVAPHLVHSVCRHVTLPQRAMFPIGRGPRGVCESNTVVVYTNVAGIKEVRSDP